MDKRKVIPILRRKARGDAAMFFAEFGVALNPIKTDWDCEAFNTAFTSLPPDAQNTLKNHTKIVDRGWHVYQEALVKETVRLAAKGKTP